MSATDEAQDAGDALFVLTAVLLTPAQFPSVLGDDYPEACSVLGLEPYAGGYGLVLGQDGDGARWTVVTDDVSLVACAIAAWDCGMEYDLSPSDRTVIAALPGWPLAVAVAAPDVPAPHDPEPDADVDEAEWELLSPPDSESWGPAQRRLGADEIALQWAAWREQIDDEAEFGAAGAKREADGGNDEELASATEQTSGTASAGEAEHEPGEEDEPSTGQDSDAAQDSDAGDDASPEPDAPREPAEEQEPAEHQQEDGTASSSAKAAVRRVLDEARGYLDAPPPPGRIRSAFASGDARTLRVDGPGWSMVARTDDIAFILLDEEPGEVLPVGRGPELPGLLKALDELAVRPS
ncbi:hypothetical protein [Streptomyces sp. NPDC048639]|uniref:hypothetical protein n=1 Tax=Streptomyces sp. NPDC048639 TaxID=3365581 RepID=UPI0037126DE5